MSELEAKVKLLESRVGQVDQNEKGLKDILDRLSKERHIRNREQLLWLQERDELSAMIDTLTRDCLGVMDENERLKSSLQFVAANSRNMTLENNSASSTNSIEGMVGAALAKNDINPTSLSIINPKYPIILSPQAIANVPADMETRRKLFDTSRATLIASVPPLPLNSDIFNVLSRSTSNSLSNGVNSNNNTTSPNMSPGSTPYAAMLAASMTGNPIGMNGMNPHAHQHSNSENQ